MGAKIVLTSDIYSSMREPRSGTLRIRLGPLYILAMKSRTFSLGDSGTKWCVKGCYGSRPRLMTPYDHPQNPQRFAHSRAGVPY